MASFAQLDENNNIINVIKIANDDDILDSNGIENENLGIEKCISLFGLGTSWKQTWFGTNPRRYRTAIVGGEYNEQYDVFVARRPYPSWTLNETTYLWESPTPQPTSEEPKAWYWNEDTLTWLSEDIPRPPNPIDIEGNEISGEFTWNTTDNFWEFVPEPVEEETTEE